MQNVSVGQNLMTLVSLDDIWITANFKETQLRMMRPGQAVKIHVDAYGRDYDGKVTQIGGATGSMLSLFPPENATGNYVKVVQRIPVRIDLTDRNEDKDHLLRPGLSVEPTVRVRMEDYQRPDLRRFLLSSSSSPVGGLERPRTGVLVTSTFPLY